MVAPAHATGEIILAGRVFDPFRRAPPSHDGKQPDDNENYVAHRIVALGSQPDAKVQYSNIFAYGTITVCTMKSLLSRRLGAGSPLPSSGTGLMDWASCLA